MNPARIKIGGISMITMPRFIILARSACWAAAVRKHITHCAKALEDASSRSASNLFIAPPSSSLHHPHVQAPQGVRHENNEHQNDAQHQHGEQCEEQAKLLELQGHEVGDNQRHLYNR